MKVKKYTVLKEFRIHGKGRQEVGTVVEMAEQEARYLLKEGKLEVNKTTANMSKSKETGGK
ncbi:hypothetical protein [Maridesulfovibrio hydrothermalis]|uniref:Uncharacterized protein n=1 Tax=Maridesulfovibrio hydrothermalis AM13 = DSM 14728 TaxID=1121451 RepID=L0R9F8_9BACT|nr:hypothetical protein [Maridesulfovibrio hydrothermalis]CCO22221.1 protein of unknown function [Maridesulfovibrio hydrothermalis AM13 = DSM 14728]